MKWDIGSTCAIFGAMLPVVLTYVDDTPQHNTSNGGCPSDTHRSTCTGTPLEMWMNYMDYTYDECMYMFTDLQRDRMRTVFAAGGARASMAQP
jgi:hypothetical protein